MPATAAWLAALQGAEAVPAAQFNGDPQKAVSLPGESVAKAWMHYVRDTAIPDATPPPAPANLRVNGSVLTWETEADLESGLAGFIIERDGEPLARLPVQPKNPYGRLVFQGLQYSDTPAQPLVAMTFPDPKAVPGRTHTYRVIAVNTAGLNSE
jgi:hypothetical protein